MSSLKSRVGKLESTIGKASYDGDYDDWVDSSRDHVGYVLLEEGDVMLFDSDFTRFQREEDLWSAHPVGTKFRCITGNYVVCDGVKRQLNFPPSDGKLSPETQAVLDRVFAM